MSDYYRVLCWVSRCACGAVALSLAGLPVHAGTPMTDAFAANVWSNANFLDQSSRLAMTRATDRKTRDFARAEADEQTAAANAIVAWMESNTVEGAASATGRVTPHDVTLGAIVTAPLRATADNVDAITSGRSVAIDEPVVTVPRHVRALPNAAANLDKLQGAHGSAFDALYASAQRDALLQLSTIYAAYIRSGEDPGLRSLSVRELATVDTMLAKLRGLGHRE